MYVTKKFPKQELLNLLDDDPSEGYEIVVEPKLYETRRWSNCYEMIFSYEGNFYSTTYSRGATEMQDESPYEYAPEEIACTQVIPKEVTTIIYEALKA